MSFLDSLESVTNKNSFTQNGAISNDSSLDAVLDFFSKAGAMRGKEDQAYSLFKKAYSQDKNLALKALFYIRDVRGGQGERSVFKYIFDRLDSDVAIHLTHLVPNYGRWDDFTINSDNIHIIQHQLEDDLRAMSEQRSVSLLAKWLPSENTSSKETRTQARKVASLLDLKSSQYRKKIVSLRKYIKLLEQDMSSNQWSEVNYSGLPSQAFKKHTKAFNRHDEQRFKKFLEDVNSGKETVNSGTLFTYDIYDMLNVGSYWKNISESEINAANALWDNLPDYTNGTNALVMADVSGSMDGRPMSVSVSLATYFAERNVGPFKDKYLTFTNVPRIVTVSGNNIKEKFECVQLNNVGYDTNLQLGFDAILKAAIESNASQEELPKTLYIISDMQFNDSTIQGTSDTNLEVAKKKFKDAGYEMPTIVFWNVNAYGDSPATKYDKNVTLVSGFNQSTFQHVVDGKTPLESMYDILNSARYLEINI